MQRETASVLGLLWLLFAMLLALAIMFDAYFSEVGLWGSMLLLLAGIIVFRLNRSGLKDSGDPAPEAPHRNSLATHAPGLQATQQPPSSSKKTP